jgi:hypothetical protein
MNRPPKIVSVTVAILLLLFAEGAARATCATAQRPTTAQSTTYDTSTIAGANEGDDADDPNPRSLIGHVGNGTGQSPGQWWAAFTFDAPAVSTPLTSATVRLTWYRDVNDTYITQATSADFVQLFPVLGPWDNSTSNRALWADDASYDTLVTDVGFSSAAAGSGPVDSGASGATVIYTDASGPALWQITYDVTAWAQSLTWAGGSATDYGLGATLYQVADGSLSPRRASYETEEWTNPFLVEVYPGAENLGPSGYQPVKADARELWTFCW